MSLCCFLSIMYSSLNINTYCVVFIALYYCWLEKFCVCAINKTKRSFVYYVFITFKMSYFVDDKIKQKQSHLIYSNICLLIYIYMYIHIHMYIMNMFDFQIQVSIGL